MRFPEAILQHVQVYRQAALLVGTIIPREQFVELEDRLIACGFYTAVTIKLDGCVKLLGIYRAPLR